MSDAQKLKAQSLADEFQTPVYTVEADEKGDLVIVGVEGPAFFITTDGNCYDDTAEWSADLPVAAFPAGVREG